MASYFPRSSRVGQTPLVGQWPVTGTQVVHTPTFPTFRGLSIRVKRKVVYITSKTTSVTGYEQRITRRRFPRYQYELTIEVLIDQAGDVASFVDFVTAQRGRAGKFMFTDPLDGVARLCRFDSDDFELSRIVDGLWSVATLELITVK